MTDGPKQFLLASIPDDALLHIAKELNHWKCDEAAAACRVELERRNPKPPEPKDEWWCAIDEGLAESVGKSAIERIDSILSALAPLREALEKKRADELEKLSYVCAAEWREAIWEALRVWFPSTDQHAAVIDKVLSAIAPLHAAEKQISEQWAKAAGEWKEKAERLAKAVVDAVANTP
jgi:hypothetical protein